jgi:hypothetical protein
VPFRAKPRNNRLVHKTGSYGRQAGIVERCPLSDVMRDISDHDVREACHFSQRSSAPVRITPNRGFLFCAAAAQRVRRCWGSRSWFRSDVHAHGVRKRPVCPQFSLSRFSRATRVTPAESEALRLKFAFYSPMLMERPIAWLPAPSWTKPNRGRILRRQFGPTLCRIKACMYRQPLRANSFVLRTHRHIG